MNCFAHGVCACRRHGGASGASHARRCRARGGRGISDIVLLVRVSVPWRAGLQALCLESRGSPLPKHGARGHGEKRGARKLPCRRSPARVGRVCCGLSLILAGPSKRRRIPLRRREVVRTVRWLPSNHTPAAFHSFLTRHPRARNTKKKRKQMQPIEGRSVPRPGNAAAKEIIHR